MVHDGYVIVPNALEPQLAKDLLSFTQTQETFTQAAISTNKNIDSNKRTDKTLWLEDSPSEKNYLDFAQELQNYLNRELYLGIQHYESHFAIYDVGNFYEKHLDAFKDSNKRVITTIYYLNQAWNHEDSGELIIYTKDGNLLQKVYPKANTLVLFLSDTFPHEVKPTNKKRYSIAGWFRTDRQ